MPDSEFSSNVILLRGAASTFWPDTHSHSSWFTRWVLVNSSVPELLALGWWRRGR